MSLDGALLHCVKQELTNLIGARVDKIYQPSREEIVITLRNLNSADKSRKSLVFSANSTAARVHLTYAEFDNPQTPPMFCMLLRKHLGNGRLTDIRQDGLERILFFDFECVNEIGDVVVNTLTAEIMGRNSNIILTRDGRVVDSVKRISAYDADVPAARRILPNIPYELPARTERMNLLTANTGEIITKIENSRDRLAKTLMNTLEGISPIFARECAFYAADDVDAVCGEANRQRLSEFLENAKNALNGEAKFTLLIDSCGKKKDFCFMEVRQYGTEMTSQHFSSANELLDSFFTETDRQGRTRQRIHELLKTLSNVYSRISRRLELRKKELSDCAGREVFRVCGDLINANIYRLERGMTKCVLEDFYSGEQREIMLDARLTPAQNAQKYYSEYRKLDTAEKKLTELIRGDMDELSYLDSVIDCVTRTESEQELSEIRRELREQGYIRSERRTEKRQKLSEPLKYRSSDGFEILVGKNNRQNDLLTLKTAKAADIWLHVKDIAGSHVIIRTDGKSPSKQTLLEAANLAAFHSKAREGSGVPVDYVPVKFVKKPAGAKPGMVIFTNNRTLYVTPNTELAERLSDKH